ncbi:CHASE2 domain-containing protein [Roseospira visakhapatnamensis]|uniref:Serine phosphatase RsbU (Regulator of sigma subunit)/CHASE2 domain-containing sensor protein n=1 Tax=Roseospira visakhapatnamensis TaxID=390880 RepID=A0A7W6WBF4_9PROT|nr:CHASE2 domain-containing protein [Roseospira visakhapatnamensis]MBB4267441.1 serine phosphatase RsbU (regulator of sigma subunit)/CHASE2 domain-containing sensor protein [Roseospira visakhapatnamensis]
MRRGGRLPAALLGLVLAAVLALEPGVLTIPRNVVFDFYQALSPRPRVDDPVVVVAVDDKSLDALGQWPWPRSLTARVMDRVAQADPTVIGVDVLFAEPDRMSPKALAETLTDLPARLRDGLRGAPDTDHLLALALTKAPTVLGFAAISESWANPDAIPPLTPVLRRGPDSHRRLAVQANSAIASHAVIATSAAAHGVINPLLGADGVVRRLPFLANLNGEIALGLAPEMIRIVIGHPVATVTSTEGGVRSLHLGPMTVPLDRDGGFRVPFGPVTPERYLSAVDILDGSVDPSVFTGRLVLVGVVASGLGDLASTPLDSEVPGVEVHMQALEALVQGLALRRPAWVPWIEALLCLGGALVLCAVGPHVRHTWPLFVLVAGTTMVGAQQAHAQAALLIDGTLPAVGQGLVLAVLMANGLAESRREQLRLAADLRTQSEARARLEGEMNAARDIQRALLPDPRRVLAREPRVAVAAALEPARTVGGDLYDLFPIDADRLVFVVGDVSGKGIQASLFMAICKALSKSAAHGAKGSPAAAVGQANRDLDRENPQMLFCTALMGVLDLRDGTVTLCNAGHGPPLLVDADGGQATVVTTAGGPALCFLDDIDYQETRITLRPRQTLVLTTDGITEAMSPTGAVYGSDRLTDVATHALGADRTVDEALSMLLADVHAWVGDAPRADDLTAMLVRWTGPAPTS